MTPKQRVFETLRNLVQMISGGEDLNQDRGQLVRSLENAISWEPWLIDAEVEQEGTALVTPNVKLTGL